MTKLIMLTMVFLSSCAYYEDYPMEVTDGRYFDSRVVTNIIPYKSKKTDIETLLGKPYEIQRKGSNENWIYFMKRSKKSKTAFHSYTEVYSQQLILTFEKQTVIKKDYTSEKSELK